MKADAKLRIPLCDADGVFGGGLVHHEARLRQKPGAVRLFDGRVDRRAAAEIVGGEDEVFQCAESACILRRSFR